MLRIKPILLVALAAAAVTACSEDHAPGGKLGSGGEDTAAPQFGGVVSLDQIKATSLVARWLPADDNGGTAAAELRYNVYVGEGSQLDSLSSPGAVATGVTSRTLSGLTSGVQYCVLVRAEDAAGNEDGNENQTCAVTPVDAAAPVFGGLIAATLAQSGPPEIALGWLPAIDDHSATAELEYRIYRATTAGGQDFATPLAAVTGTSGFTDSTVQDNRIYYYVVRAVDETGNADGNALELTVSTPFDSAGFGYAYHPGLHDLGRMGSAVAFVDWDGDGILDVAAGAYLTGNPGDGAVAAYRAGQVTLYLGDGAGRFGPDPAVQFYSPNTIVNGYFGRGLAACDIAGDGTADDLLVGAAGERRVYVYLNGAGGADTTADRTIPAPSGQGDTDNFGEGVGCADINGTGGDEIVVAAPYSDNNGATDSGTLFFYNNNSVSPVIDIDGPNASYWMFPQDDFVGQIPDNNQPLCGEALILGDFDGNGDLDLAVGCPLADTAGTNDGVIVFYTRPDYTDADTWTTAGLAQAPNANDQWGWALALGNLDDRDPGTELAVGQRYYDSPGTNAGAVFLHDLSFAGTFSLSAPLTFFTDRGPNGDYASFGSALAAADTDGDGAAELLVGAADEDGAYQSGNVSADLGALYLFAGAAGALIDPLPEQSEFSVYETTTGAPVHGGALDMQFGRGLCTGDIDNDGRDDLLVGAENDPTDGKESATRGTGRVYVWYSVPSGELPFSGAPDAVFTAPGLVPGKRFGTGCVVMDYDNDGWNDVAIGAQYADDYAGDQGAVYVYLGVASANTGGADTGSVPVGGTPGLTLRAPLATATASHYFGSALAACDLTGDGFPELIVGARQFDGTTAVSGSARGSTNEGAVFVFQGSVGGVDPASYQALFPTDQDVGLSSFGQGGYSDNNFGYAVACYPSVGGSSALDLAVGAPYAAKPGGNGNQGMVAVFQGAVNQDPTGGGNSCSGNDEYVGSVCLMDDTRDLRIDDQGLIVNDDSLFGSALARGDWDGSGGTDLAVGAARARRPAPEPNNNGGVYFFRGATGGGFQDLSGGVPLSGGSLLDPTNFGGNNFADGALGLADLNNNGIPELIVGANRCSYDEPALGARGSFSGCVYIDRGDYRP